MKIATLITAVGLVFATGAGFAAPAAAQERVIQTTRTTTIHRETGIRPMVRNHRRYQSCTMRWRNNHRVRVCRWRNR